MLYARKNSTVEARPFEGPGSLTVVSRKRGDQFASKGDYLVTDESVVAGESGSIYVISKAEFEAEFEPVVSVVEAAAVEEIAPAV